MKTPLQGIKVLDLSRILAGPWASQLLGDYGAEVVKVERPVTGDDTRLWGPPWLAGTDGEAAYFLAANRNKRSVVIDIDTEAGQDLVRKLAAEADVLIENFRPGSLASRQLDADSLRRANPRLVYCLISAYASDSSKRHEPGYDAMIQASAGLMSINGASAREGGGPQKVGVAVADIMAGMYAVTAILAALHARSVTGKGQFLEVPLYDSQVAWLANQSMNYLVSGQVPERLGNAHPNIVPYQTFATRDSYLMLAVGNDLQFRKCVNCLGLDELGEHPRFQSNAARVQNRDALVDLMQGALEQQDTATWLEKLRSAGVPCGPINDLAAVFSGPYAKERQLVRTLVHPQMANLPTVANPVRFSATPVRYDHAPPLLGQHSGAVLHDWLGYSARDVQELQDSGVITQGTQS